MYWYADFVHRVLGFHHPTNIHVLSSQKTELTLNTHQKWWTTAYLYLGKQLCISVHLYRHKVRKMCAHVCEWAQEDQTTCREYDAANHLVSIRWDSWSECEYSVGGGVGDEVDTAQRHMPQVEIKLAAYHTQLHQTSRRMTCFPLLTSKEEIIHSEFTSFCSWIRPFCLFTTLTCAWYVAAQWRKSSSWRSPIQRCLARQERSTRRSSWSREWWKCL